MPRLLGACVLLCLAGTVAAEVRPGVGLALSGGGARGLAHIGVLKVLEEMHIPVNCIAGTSMGALIGGTYASGVNAAYLEREALTTDWEAVFSSDMPRSMSPFRLKSLDWYELRELSVGLNRGRVALPEAALGSQKIDLFIRRQTQDMTAAHFDDLPIRFRAVASDLETGAPVVLDRGDLSLALRASMAVPGAFSSVKQDGRSLVDGGISQNLPVTVARETCPGPVVAVNVATPPMQQGEIRSLFDVADQVTRLLMQQNLQQQLGLLSQGDTLISPDLSEWSSADFRQAAHIVAAGEAAARAALPALRRYGVSDEEYARWQATVIGKFPTRTPPRRVEVASLSHVNPDSLLRNLPIQKDGSIEQAALHNAILQAYASGDFERIDYRLSPSTDGQVLTIQPVEKPWGPDYVLLGIGLSTDFEGSADYRVTGMYRRTWMNSLGAEWRTLGQLGADRWVLSEWYQPLQVSGPWFLAGGASSRSKPLRIFQEGHQQAEVNVLRQEGFADVGYSWRNTGELRLGVFRGRTTADARVGTMPSLSGGDRYQLGGLRAALDVDRLDNPHFPQAGQLLRLRHYWADGSLGSEAKYRKVSAEWQLAGSLDVNTALLTLRVVDGLGTRLPPAEYTSLGGFLDMSAFDPDALMAEELRFGRLQLYRETGKLSKLLGKAVYAGLSLEMAHVGHAVDPLRDGRTHRSVAVYGASDTVLGPVYLGLGIGEQGRAKVFFSLGTAF